jgi:glycogen debranching enzyme
MEPGKILHELRRGDLTVKGEMPHSPYYGSVDSTLLFILLYAEMFKWVDDPALFAELWPNVVRALEWAEQYGDLDGDGYIELKRRSPRGILHQGWKDSDESLGGDLGPRPSQPLALVEVQGYWYAAMLGLAETLRRYGHGEQIALAERLEGKAATLKEQFNRDFWWPEESFYAQALDAAKRQVRAVTSNIGHCLWNGIIDEEKAPTVVQRLVQSDMLSGWGVRTMSMQDPSYNPMSYHNGSVWPHDNSLLIMGLRRYGFHQEMLRVVEEIFAAATTFPDGRLPELYCGFERGTGEDREAAPAPYPVSCSPQAWAAGTPLLVLQALLGLEPDPRDATLRISPQLPEGIDDINLAGLRVGDSRADLVLWRDPTNGGYGVSASPGPDEPGALKVTLN